MAPRLISENVFDLLGLIGVSISVNALLLDLTLRAVGFVIFVVLVVRNRRNRDEEPDSDDTVAAASASN